MLTQSQHADGYWTRNWPDAEAARDDAGSSIADRILVTGHQLEWLALAPPDVLPPRETLVRAAQWLSRATVEVDEETLERSFGPFTHAARALCLWRSRDPFEIWQQARETPETSDTNGYGITTEEKSSSES